MKKKIKFLFCICTRKRKNKLIKVIKSISDLKIRAKISIQVLIVQNEKKSKLKKIDLKTKISNIIIVNEKNIGISFARNRCLKESSNIVFDYLVFLDDDCTIDKYWLIENLNFIKNNKYDIVTGPHISKNNFYLNILERKLKHNSQLRWASTNNVIVKKKVLKKKKITFDTNIQFFGGEDQLFFWKLKKKGYKIGWNSFAKVYDDSANFRINFSWFVKRSFGYGCSSFHIYKEIYKNFAYLISILKVFYDFLLFFFYLAILPISPKSHFLKLIHYISRAFGCISSTFLKYNLKRY